MMSELQESRTSPFIREYLLQHEEACPYEVYEALRTLRREMKMNIPSSKNIYFYFWVLRKLGLIEFTREGEVADSPLGRREGLKKRYFRIRRDLAGSKMWKNPQKFLESAP